MSNISEDLGRFDSSFQSNKKIWAIGGGKGGVGKSLVTANLSIALALKGYQVLAIDLDLGGANLHTCLGMPIPEKTLSDYITQKVKKFDEIIIPTPIDNLSLISGAQDELGIANLKNMQKNKLLKSLNSVAADVVLIDLGAGTNFNTLDFFISSQKGILVVLPEPTSIENTYRFIKSVYYRRLKMVEEFLDLQPQFQKALNAKIQDQVVHPVDLINELTKDNLELREKIQHEIKKLNLQIIINQARNDQDIEIGNSMRTICQRFFGIDMQYLGHILHDPIVWQSVKKRRPVLIESPNSRLAENFERICNQLLEE